MKRRMKWILGISVGGLALAAAAGMVRLDPLGTLVLGVTRPDGTQEFS